MNKIIISSVLAATALIAGMFAFMPVEKASTVHTIIQASERDNVVIFGNVANATGFVPTGGALTIIDNAGIGGTSNVEIVWKFTDADCTMRTLTGTTLSAALTDDLALDTPLGDTALNHRDGTAVDAVLIKASPGRCDLLLGNFVSVSTVKGE